MQVAALANPAISSWMALRTRVDLAILPKGFSVLVMGATSESGKIAVEFARHLGAGKLIGVARNAEKLASVGVDVAIVLKENVEETDFSGMGHVDVILDYIFSAPTLQLLKSLKAKVPVQFVHIGGLAGPTVELPGGLLRRMNLTIRGCGPGAWTFSQLVKEVPEMLEPVARLARRDFSIVKLADVEEKWNQKIAGERIVYVP